MKTTNKAIQEQTSYKVGSANQEEPLEYFIASQSFGFQFCYREAQDPNFAENMVEEVKND